MTLTDNNQAILNRLIYIIDEASGHTTRAEVARRIGMDPSNLSKHLSGKLAISKALINRLVVELGVSRQWLVHGEGVPFEKPVHASVIEAEELKPARQGLPVYDVDVTAGAYPLERMLVDDHIKGYVDLPRMNPDCVLVRVNGNSMEPNIIDGGFIAIRPIKSTSSIFWGQIYVVVLEDYRMVKYLRRHPNDASMVVLHSANPDYDDMEISRNEIQALFLVEGVLNYRNLC